MQSKERGTNKLAYSFQMRSKPKVHHMEPVKKKVVAEKIKPYIYHC